nr:hypothetical protein [uncultured Campylobacter sp.]
MTWLLVVRYTSAQIDCGYGILKDAGARDKIKESKTKSMPYWLK